MKHRFTFTTKPPKPSKTSNSSDEICRAVALITSPGKKKVKKKLLYLCNNDDVKERKIKAPDLDMNQLKKSKLAYSKINELRNCVIKREEPHDPKLKEMYIDILGQLQKSFETEFKLSLGSLMPVPNIYPGSLRECAYVAAPSGSGKSTWTANYMRRYNDIFPKNNIFIVSKVRDDPAFQIDELEENMVFLSPEDIENWQGTMDDLQDSLVVFDDTDTISDKDTKDKVQNIRNSILETGRHTNTSCIITSHLVNNYKETRIVLNECHCITLFPSSGGTHQIQYCLKTYFGLNQKQITRLCSLPSRWISVYKNYPQYCIYQTGAFFLQ